MRDSVIKHCHHEGSIVISGRPPLRPFPLLAVVLSRVDFPYLVMGRPDFRCNICWMDVNHKQAGQLAVNYILDRGYRRLAFVIGSLDDPLAQSRFAGIRQVMKEEELPVAVLSSRTPYTLDAGCLERLLTQSYCTFPAVLERGAT